ncbi:MAG: DeoR/GlpR family DNA-binding transcription regulator [Actinobacteria bacterium]|nr:DeoR/GlpR family DNA-binding transcription regulator [Actinomycetota bacterium]
MATTSTADSEERRARLLEIVANENVIRLTAAAGEFGVSTMTIRRDLESLETEGLLRRVRGGAVSVIGPRPFSDRRAVRLHAKETIAEKALSLVPHAGSIALDASTTVATLAARFGVRSGLTVATNSYQTYGAMRSSHGVDVILIGGETEEITDSFVGPIAVHAAESLRYGRFFASASAIDTEYGTSEVSLREAEMKRTFFRMAKELVLCIDSSKLRQQSTAACLPLDSVAVLVTELSPSDPRLDEFRDRVELL